MAVEHDEAQRRFVIHLPGGDARLDYERPDASTINLRHTEVPETERGHGAAAELAQAAVAYAKAQKLRVIPTCRFVKAWFDRHPSEKDIIAK
jgi:predicted GNAT family acetyltransferase